MVWPSRREASGLVHPEFAAAVVTAYRGAAYLRDVIMHVTEAQHVCPSLFCVASGLASTVAGVAADTLVFAQYDSHTNQRPSVIQGRLPGHMQYAAEAVRYLHLLAQHLSQLGRHNLQGVVPALIRLLTWLSKPTTAIATASGVLAEALPALRLKAADDDVRRMLAASGGPQEWVPVAEALKRRLPRRMAARFLPDIDCVSAVVAGRGAGAVDAAATDTTAVAAAEAAMSTLLQARTQVMPNAAVCVVPT